MFSVLKGVAGVDRRLVRFVCAALVCGAASSLLAGCQTTETASTEAATAAAAAGPVPPGKARLVLTRISAYYASALAAVVKVNGEEVARVSNGASQSVIIAPGPTAVNIDSWSAPGSYTINLDVKPGRTYRVEISPRTEAIAPAMVFGMAGALVEAAAKKDKAGAFQARIVE